MTVFKRTVEVPDTFGMSSRSARRHQQRARGEIAADQGRHRGGPCPAVALATLTGWSYARAERYLEDHGFRGAGMFREQYVPALIDLLGEPVERHDSPGCSVTEAGRRYFGPGLEGVVACRGHVMPVRRGRVLNGTSKHLAMRAELVVVWRIDEEVVR